MTPYPLAWPETLARSKSKATSRFRTSLAGAMKNVRDELQLFANDSGKKIEELVISSNVALGQETPADTGVAVWFRWDGLQVAIAVDRYAKVQDNLQAIAHIIDARRTELRHGGLEIVRATFRGFTALPAPEGKRAWKVVFGLERVPTVNIASATIENAYRNLAKKAHPDAGGSADAMAELNRARDEALKEIAG